MPRRTWLAPSLLLGFPLANLLLAQRGWRIEAVRAEPERQV